MSENGASVPNRENYRDYLDVVLLADAPYLLEPGEVSLTLAVEPVEPRRKNHAVKPRLGGGLDDALDIHDVAVSLERPRNIDPAIRKNFALTERAKANQEQYEHVGLDMP